MAIAAYGVLVYVATRPNAPRPIKGYYETAQRWDADEAVEASSRQLGWVARYDFPAGVPHTPGMPRPVDVRVVDRDGTGITGLSGRLFAMRPSDPRLNQTGDLVGLPHEAGSYRTLVRLDQPGVWEFRLDARRDAVRFVHAARVSLAAEAPPQTGAAR
jgi:hypothetical protein